MALQTDRNQINQEMRNVVYKLAAYVDAMSNSITKRKNLMKKAAQPMLQDLRANAPVDTGALRNSMAFMTFKDPYAVYVGPRYNSRTNADGQLKYAIAPHAHLVEFGYITKSGDRVKGRPFIKNTYEKNRILVLNNLKAEVTKLAEQLARETGR